MKYQNIYSFLLGLGVLLALSSCEDIIDVDLDPGTNVLTIDAWITNEVGNQQIRLLFTQGYLDNSPLTPALGATVRVEDNEGRIFDFLDPDNDGFYIWEPVGNDTVLGRIGNQYNLTVTFEGETYTASSEIKRVPPIDSLVTEFREEELGEPEGYYAELFARDIAGSGDAYWIRSFKNGVFQNRPFDLNIAFDAGFSQGGNIDGLTFISPIREGINPFVEDEDGEIMSPYQPGDTVRVELYSITQEAFDFLEEVSGQIQNGGLFAIPISNVSTNIINQNPDSPNQAVGYFGASGVSTETAVVLEE
ncbi:MAG: DUF4249 domain-containing protein [Bacteroidota bacterium]